MQNFDIQNNNTTIFLGSINPIATDTSINFNLNPSSKFLMTVAIGAGGGGSSGWSDALGSSVTPGGGGGGTGSSHISFVAAFELPGSLTVVPGSSGAGGVASRAASSPGGSGRSTAVRFSGSTSNTVSLSITNPGGGATAATTAAGGGGGGAVLTSFPCINTTRAGITGVAGSTTGSVSSTIPVHNLFLNGGGGGGITTTDSPQSGAGVSAFGLQPNISTGAGSPKRIFPYPVFDSNVQGYYSTGGTGGSSAASGPGRDGCNGGVGSGGGGGGGSNSAADSGGSGGSGGIGMAILIQI